MILPFMHKWPDGLPTFFEEKINSMVQPGLSKEKTIGKTWHWVIDGKHYDMYPKIHTIRVDEKNRWKAGRLVHAYYHSRSPQMREIWKGSCVSVQNLKVRFGVGLNQFFIQLYIDGRKLSLEQCDEFYRNDGCTQAEFMQYIHRTYCDCKLPLDKNGFFNFDFKIIHFTKFRY